jgi:effector-binding domain-containing protein
MAPSQKITIMTNDTLSAAPIVITATRIQPMRIIFIRDTVQMVDLRKFFSESYAELFEFAGKYKLAPGKAMAFYDNYYDLITLEAAVEVDTIPAHLPGRILTRIIDGGEAVVAHYTGPYEEMSEPYGLLAQWLLDNNKKAKGLPFEVYLNNPGMVKDSTQLKTDIYQLTR